MAFVGRKPTNAPLTSSDLGTGIVGSTNIADATITNADIASSIITGQTAETSVAGGDLVLIYDDSASALRKMTRTNFVSGIGGTNTPAFLAYRSTSNQSISNQTETQCQFQTELFDTDSNYSTSTYRFTPTTAGKYFLFAMLQLTGTINAGAYFGSIRKNGVMASLAEVYNSTTTSMSYSLVPHCIVEANGSSDYFDCTIYYAGTASFRAGIEFSQFGGYKLIGA